MLYEIYTAILGISFFAVTFVIAPYSLFGMVAHFKKRKIKFYHSLALFTGSIFAFLLTASMLGTSYALVQLIQQGESLDIPRYLLPYSLTAVSGFLFRYVIALKESVLESASLQKIEKKHANISHTHQVHEACDPEKTKELICALDEAVQDIKTQDVKIYEDIQNVKVQDENIQDENIQDTKTQYTKDTKSNSIKSDSVNFYTKSTQDIQDKKDIQSDSVKHDNTSLDSVNLYAKPMQAKDIRPYQVEFAKEIQKEIQINDSGLDESQMEALEKYNVIARFFNKKPLTHRQYADILLKRTFDIVHSKSHDMTEDIILVVSLLEKGRILFDTNTSSITFYPQTPIKRIFGKEIVIINLSQITASKILYLNNLRINSDDYRAMILEYSTKIGRLTLWKLNSSDYQALIVIYKMFLD